jgi:carboxymethylenebutenolidase
MIEFAGVPNPAREGDQPKITGKGRLFAPHSGVGPGVLVLHPWWGLNQTVLDYAGRLAGEGFVVLAPDLFDGETADTIEGAEKLSQRHEGSDEEQIALEQRALGAADWLIERTGGPIGALGFSFGAGYALWLGRKLPDKIAAIVVYYGTGGPVDGRAPVLGHFATDDPFETAENVDDLKAQLADQQREGTILRYDGTKHWFAESDRPEYDAQAAAQAYSRTLHFLNRQLGQ